MNSIRLIRVITPGDDPEWVRQEVRRLGLHGLKCYHTFANSQPTWEADIPEYLPEPIVRVAHEEGLVILLHMVKSQAVADPSNIHWISHYCKTYPNMKLILAHSARGHNPRHNLDGLGQLTGFDNLWFDTSAICEPMSHIAIWVFTCLNQPLCLVVDQRVERGGLDLHSLLGQAVEELAS